VITVEVSYPQRSKFAAEGVIFCCLKGAIAVPEHHTDARRVGKLRDCQVQLAIAVEVSHRSPHSGIAQVSDRRLERTVAVAQKHAGSTPESWDH
jgi:hypothetical protein